MAKLKQIHGDLDVAGTLSALGGLDPSMTMSLQTQTSQAAGNVAGIKGDISAIRSTLGDIAADGKLTPSEKQTLYLFWQSIESEKPNLITQAHNAGLLDSATPLVTYNARYDSLYAYLFGTGGCLVDLTTTSDIDRDDLVDAFMNYYTAASALNPAIDSAIMSLASTAAAAALAMAERAKTRVLANLAELSTYAGEIAYYLGQLYQCAAAASSAWVLTSATIPSGELLYCDGESVPEIPDNLAGTTYLNKNFIAADDWTFSHCSLSFANGKMIITATNSNPCVYRSVTPYLSKLIRVKIKKTNGAAATSRIQLTNGVGTSNTYDTPERVQEFYIPADATGSIAIYTGWDGSAVGDTYEISFIYIGTGLSDSPLIDNSGNGRHFDIHSVFPASTPKGAGIVFNGINSYCRGNLADFSFTGEFTFSAWIQGKVRTTQQMIFCRSSSGTGNRGFRCYIGANNCPGMLVSADGTNFATLGGNAGTECTEDCLLEYKYVPSVGMYIKKNGVLIKSLTTGVPASIFYSSGQYVCFGEILNVYPFDGWIAQPHLFTKQLTDAEDLGLYLVPQGNGAFYDWSDYLSDMAAVDGRITPGEKVIILQNWYEINGDGQYTGSYWQARIDAVALAVATTGLDDARTHLYDALYGVSVGVTPTPVLSAIYWDTVISLASVTAYKNLWAEYRQQHSAILSAIAAKGAANAITTAQGYADGLAEELSDEIDGKIECYLQASVPTTGMASGDIWIDSDDGNNMYRYSGTAWVDVADTGITAAYNLAAGKNTIWGTLALAQASAVVGDLFLASGRLYRVLVAGATLSTAADKAARLTPQNWGSLETAPANTPAGTVIENDTYYNTATLAYYYYLSGAWTMDGAAIPDTVSGYAPKYLGIGVLGQNLATEEFTGAAVDSSGNITAQAPRYPNPGDWMVNYLATYHPIGIYRRSISSPSWVDTTNYKYIADAAIDLCYLAVGGITVSGFTTFMTAIIKTLFVQTITLLDGGTIESDNYVAGTSGIKIIGSTGLLECMNAIISGTLKTTTIDASSAISSSDGLMSIGPASITFANYDQRNSPADGNKRCIIGARHIWFETYGTVYGWTPDAHFGAQGGSHWHSGTFEQLDIDLSARIRGHIITDNYVKATGVLNGRSVEVLSDPSAPSVTTGYAAFACRSASGIVGARFYSPNDNGWHTITVSGGW